MSVAVIAGLGNPGAEHHRTRHNLGFWLVEALAHELRATWRHETRFQAEVARVEIAGQPVWLVKPLTYMNDSGVALGPFLHFHKLPDTALAALHDDITLPLGKMKISIRGSAGGHNGIASLLAHVGPHFVRVKLGIGGKVRAEMDLKDHVLGRLAPDDEALLQSRLPDFLQALRTLATHGPHEAMNLFNRSTPNPTLSQPKLG
jgi:PTH1 family peptidyl-tRNA hydrolase